MHIYSFHYIVPLIPNTAGNQPADNCQTSWSTYHINLHMFSITPTRNTTLTPPQLWRNVWYNLPVPWFTERLNSSFTWRDVTAEPLWSRVCVTVTGQTCSLHPDHALITHSIPLYSPNYLRQLQEVTGAIKGTLIPPVDLTVNSLTMVTWSPDCPGYGQPREL